MLGFLLWFSLTLGMQESYLNEYTAPPCYTSVELHAENDWLDIYTTYRNEMNKADSFMFAPATDYFTIGATLKYKQLSLTAEHQCIHPVISSMTHDRLSGGYNRIEITIRSAP